MLDKAARALLRSRSLLDDGDFDSAASKAYYAPLHAMNAALLTKGLTFSKHSGVIAAFSQHFVKTGIIPRELGRNLTRLRRDREIGDYDSFAQVDASSAQIDVTTAAEITDRVRRWLIENQFLS